MIVVWIIVGIVIAVMIGIYLIYDVAFSTNKKYMFDEYSLPKGEQYDPYHDLIMTCVDEVKKVPFEAIEITSFDGVNLFGRYYHQKDGAPVILFLHGYRCSGVRDGNGIFLYSRSLGFNVLLADQRGHGKSKGKTITFGIKERYDCLEWVKYLTERFGNKQPIYLSGLSMGGATVLMASELDLPGNVRGVLADCPYSSPKAILCSVIKGMGFPVKPTYFLAKLGAKYIGGFDVEEASAVEAVQKSRIPILILHGDDDRFVPCHMSKECQQAGGSAVDLVLVKGAGHGMSHCVDAKTYEEAVYAFFQRTSENKYSDSK